MKKSTTPYQQISSNTKFKKILYFRKTYGLLRTWTKLVGRYRQLALISPFLFIPQVKGSGIGIIGCGQFSFSAIGFFLRKKLYRLDACYDPNLKASTALGKFFGCSIKKTATEVINSPTSQIIYIASNHASHTDYAIDALSKDKTVYIEKPISTTLEQLQKLLTHFHKSKGDLYCGYNRPHSKAIQKIKDALPHLSDPNSPLTLSCFISGHLIEPNHWYRDPKEGTRVCGNLGHWIDLAIHILHWKETLPDSLNISISSASANNPDDNLTVTITSSDKDLISITLSSRFEPFEGIQENINFQNNGITAYIDDFKSVRLSHRNGTSKYIFSKKDVGHQKAILQPFSKSKRNINEIILSSLLMLHIKDMILTHTTHSLFEINSTDTQRYLTK